MQDRNPPRVLSATDPERAAASLAREHDALARMQGAESHRIDGLVQDVGQIKGAVHGLREDVGRIGGGIDDLRDSMALLGRHAVLMETQTSQLDSQQRITNDHEKRLQGLEVEMLPLKELRADTRKIGMAIATTLVLALLGLIMYQRK